MNIKMEDFVAENRKAFDSALPSAALWDRLEKELGDRDKKKRFRLPVWAGIAATVVVLLAAGFWYAGLHHAGRSGMAAVNPAAAKEQTRFCSLIEQKRDSLEIFAAADPVLYQKFSTDLQKLARDYQGLTRDLPASPNQQLVVRAMMKNLEMQLQLLSQQLSVFSQLHTYKKESSI